MDPVFECALGVVGGVLLHEAAHGWALKAGGEHAAFAWVRGLGIAVYVRRPEGLVLCKDAGLAPGHWAAVTAAGPLANFAIAGLGLAFHLPILALLNALLGLGALSWKHPCHDGAVLLRLWNQWLSSPTVPAGQQAKATP